MGCTAGLEPTSTDPRAVLEELGAVCKKQEAASGCHVGAPVPKGGQVKLGSGPAGNSVQLVLKSETLYF